MSSTFLPGGFGSQYKSELASPYIFVIILSSVIFILIIILIIREILKVTKKNVNGFYFIDDFLFFEVSWYTS
jgi:hypothetical protein